MKVGDPVIFKQRTSQPGKGMVQAKKQGVIRRIASNGWLEIGCDGMRHRRKTTDVELVKAATV